MRERMVILNPQRLEARVLIRVPGAPRQRLGIGSMNQRPHLGTDNRNAAESAVKAISFDEGRHVSLGRHPDFYSLILRDERQWILNSKRSRPRSTSTP